MLNLKKILLSVVLMSVSVALSAQMTHGTTGLLNAPSAEMQDVKTVMLGGNYLNKELTPNPWNYGTYNYFLNATIFPFLEIAYTATMFKAKSIGIGWYTDPEKFCNQDRYFSARVRVLNEGQLPAVVVGTSDPYTESGDGEINTVDGNGYFCRFYVAATKHFMLNRERFGVSVSYVYNRRRSNHLNGIAAAITYNPSAEYDNINFSIGASYLLFDQLHAQFQMQELKYFTGGLCYKIHLR